MAENLKLSALRNQAVECVGDTFADQLFVDFTGAAHKGAADAGYNLASGDSFKAFNLPVGAVITEVGWVTHTTDAQNPTFAIDSVDANSGTTALKSATAIGAQYLANVTHVAAPEIQTTTASHILITGGTDTNNDGKVTFFVKGFVVKRQS